MSSTTRPRILCVDDEPLLLESLELNLRRSYTMTTATSGGRGLELAQAHPDIVVVVSDMRMPGMNGAEFLARVRGILPDASRVLLTGQADLGSAIDAVNEGRIFRFLTKPCPPPVLLPALAAAVEQHRLITAERVLLEQTLNGAVGALADALSLVSPMAFGTASRVRALATELGAAVGFEPRWQLEVAATLSQLGAISLPADVIQKVSAGLALNAEERQMLERAPAVAEKLLAHIPRLEPVRAILARVSSGARGSDAPSRAAAILRLCQEFDALESRGVPLDEALATLRGRGHSTDLLDTLSKPRGPDAGFEVRELPIRAVQPGMVFLDDVRMTNGALLVPRGYKASLAFAARVHNFQPGTVREPVRVRVTRAA